MDHKAYSNLIAEPNPRSKLAENSQSRADSIRVDYEQSVEFREDFELFLLQSLACNYVMCCLLKNYVKNLAVIAII